jgi:hypothetical protein
MDSADPSDQIFSQIKRGLHDVLREYHLLGEITTKQLRQPQLKLTDLPPLFRAPFQTDASNSFQKVVGSATDKELPQMKKELIEELYANRELLKMQ